MWILNKRSIEHDYLLAYARYTLVEVMLIKLGYYIKTSTPLSHRYTVAQWFKALVMCSRSETKAHQLNIPLVTTNYDFYFKLSDK